MSLLTLSKQFVGRTWPYRQMRRQQELRRLQQQIRSTEPLNVVLGSGGTQFEGWIMTDADVLDVTSARDWERLFRPDSIDRLLSEHVFEHLSEDEGRAAFRQCYRHLKPGGLFRIAVPDGNRRDPDYVAEVTPPKDGHKVLYTVETLVPLLETVGFRAEPLEYFDSQEQFHAREWDERDGFIKRSIRFDEQVAFKRGEMFYTSLIVDARKI